MYREQNRRDINLWKLIAYNQPIHRIPHSTLRFRLYGFDAEVLARADIKLNNLGLFSSRDYDKEKSSGEFRIVVLGGNKQLLLLRTNPGQNFLKGN